MEILGMWFILSIVTALFFYNVGDFMLRSLASGDDLYGPIDSVWAIAFKTGGSAFLIYSILNAVFKFLGGV